MKTKGADEMRSTIFSPWWNSPCAPTRRLVAEFHPLDLGRCINICFRENSSLVIASAGFKQIGGCLNSVCDRNSALRCTGTRSVIINSELRSAQDPRAAARRQTFPTGESLRASNAFRLVECKQSSFRDKFTEIYYCALPRHREVAQDEKRVVV